MFFVGRTLGMLLLNWKAETPTKTGKEDFVGHGALDWAQKTVLLGGFAGWDGSDQSAVVDRNSHESQAAYKWSPLLISFILERESHKPKLVPPVSRRASVSQVRSLWDVSNLDAASTKYIEWKQEKLRKSASKEHNLGHHAKTTQHQKGLS